MDLDAIEAGALGAGGGLRESRGRRRDIVERHCLRDDGLVGDLEHRMRDGGGRQRSLAADVLARVPAAMAELDRGFCAAAVDLVDQAGEAGEESVVIDAELAAAMAAGAR